MRSRESSHEQKRRNGTPLFVFLLLSPYIVGFSSPDSSYSYTESMYGIGGGQYVYHDCSGAHKRPFADVGFYSGKKFDGPYRIGISLGGAYVGDGTALPLIYPDLALDWENFSIGTTGIRFGSQNKFYLESKWGDQPPFLSGKGFLRMGFGWKPDPYSPGFWIGTNVFPYTNTGLALQVEFPLQENRSIFINGRYGIDRESTFDEYGISFGIRILTY
ncbi:MAG: hypothetical protein HYV29_02760 [Ignavibacteriales bacterium]|nr:hypothetical protein [Ignavibacteriales bacterium]